MSNDIERELAKILARDNELRDAEASEKRKQEAAIAAAVIEWESRVCFSPQSNRWPRC